MERHKELKKQNTAIPEGQGAVQKLSLRQRTHRIPLQNLVLSSMADGDLFATLFNLYFYCLSECADDVGYAWYSEDFSRTIKGKEYGFLYKTDVVENEANKSFIGSFDALKKAALDYYDNADDKQRKRFDTFIKRIGWRFDDVVDKYHNIVKATIVFYEQKLLGYFDLLGEFYFSDTLNFDWIGAISEHIGRNIYPYKIHKLAYWYCGISESIKKCRVDNCWWEQSAMTGKELSDFLSDKEKKKDIFHDRTKDAALDLIGRALKNMQPVIERISKADS